MLGDIGFSYAYRYADISQAYPMARAPAGVAHGTDHQYFRIRKTFDADCIGGNGNHFHRLHSDAASLSAPFFSFRIQRQRYVRDSSRRGGNDRIYGD